MPAPVAFRAVTGADVALTAATAKTVLSCIAAASRILLLTELGISFDATATGNEAVLVELCKCDQATAGTSTSVTPVQVRGDPSYTAAFTAAKNFTAEPTAITVVSEYLVEPKSGLLVVQFPLGREVWSDIADALLLRCTAPNAVNARAYLEVEE
jgi:hypothetical protein